MTETDVKEKPKNIRTQESAEENAPTAALIAFSTNLRKYRAIHRLSQYNIADITGLNQQVISAIERCDVNPTLKTLCVIADAIGVSLPKLLTSEEDFK